MNFSELVKRAMEVRQRFGELEMSKNGRAWSREEVMQGFIVDVGDLMRLVMAKSGVREVSDVDAKLAHELSDCLWSILVLAQLYDVDLESEFLRTMAEIESRISRDARPAEPDARANADR